MFELSLAFNARVEGLAGLPMAVAVALKEVSALLRQRHRVIARAGHADGLDEALLTQVPKVARSRISRSIVVFSEITTGDHSKRADGCERSRFRAAQRVLAIS